MYTEQLHPQPTPEERTQQLSLLDVRELAQEFEGRVLVNPDKERAVRVDTAVAFPRHPQPGETGIGTRYTKGIKGISIDTLEPLTLWTPPIRRIMQSLVAARDGESLGACVRLYRASSFDTDSGNVHDMDREGDIATHLNLQRNTTYSLSFINNTEFLYLSENSEEGVLFDGGSILDNPSENQTVEENIDAEETNRYFDNLLSPQR